MKEMLRQQRPVSSHCEIVCSFCLRLIILWMLGYGAVNVRYFKREVRGLNRGCRRADVRCPRVP